MTHRPMYERVILRALYVRALFVVSRDLLAVYVMFGRHDKQISRSKRIGRRPGETVFAVYDDGRRLDDVSVSFG